MARFGIVVEGPCDELVLRELLPRCLGADCEIESRAWSTSGGVTRKFCNSLNEFKYLGIDKAFVVRDSDGKDPSALKANMQARIGNRQYPFQVNLIVIVQELEAWLLADEGAIAAVTSRPVPRQPDPIEAIASPKERLKRILSPSTVYTKEVARCIAAAIVDISRVADRCPVFKAFWRLVLDC
jgi:hypothetical protein